MLSNGLDRRRRIFGEGGAIINDFRRFELILLSLEVTSIDCFLTGCNFGTESFVVDFAVEAGALSPFDSPPVSIFACNIKMASLANFFRKATKCTENATYERCNLTMKLNYISIFL